MEPEQVNLEVDLAGVKLANPVVIASGTFGFGEEFSRIDDFDHRSPGAIALKGITLEPRLGNPPPRVAETPSGMLNSIGLQNPGVDALVERILPTLRDFGPRLIANIAGHSFDDYARVAETISNSKNADVLSALEVNISCPNVKSGGIAFGSQPETAARAVGDVKNATQLPIIAKLTPAAPDITAVAQACIEAGADIISLINTLPGMVIDTRTRRPLLGNRVGGLSGPAIRPVAVLLVHRVYLATRETSTPIIGMGGITCADDALQFIIAGASAVGVGTALFRNCSVCTEIVAGLRDRLAEENIGNLTDIVGTLK